MRNMTKNAEFANWIRQAEMKEWKAIPEVERPTWEQFKRGLKKKKKWHLRVDFFLKSDILFFVMGIMKDLFLSELSCEEQFELNAWCDERREADIAAQDADMVDEEMARQSDAQLAEDAALDILIGSAYESFEEAF